MYKKTKKFFVCFLVLILSFIALTGCGSKSSKEEESAKIEKSNIEESEYLVSVDWLLKNINKENLLVIDARTEDAYNKGHIEGAINATWQSFSNMNGAPGGKGWGVVVDAKKLSQRLSSIGVNKEKEIVVYADSLNGWGEDGRLVWMFKMAGIENVRILDGGIDLWISKGNDTTKESTKPVKVEYQVGELNTATTIDIDELKERLETVKIIDTREEAEYNGETKYGEKRGGHLPGAIQLSFKEMLNEDGTFKSKEELDTIFHNIGLKKDDEIVTYCTAGIRSAHMQIALDMAGYKNVKNYDGSFYEWAADKSCHVSTDTFVIEGYQYYKPTLLKNKMESNKEVITLDIQVEEEFKKHHIKGAIPTYAFPVKSAEDQGKLDGTLSQLEESDLDIVIVCPRGKGGAKRTYDYLKQKGISSKRLFILEKGQQGWPYDGFLEK